MWYPVEKETEKQQRYTRCGTLLKKKSVQLPFSHYFPRNEYSYSFHQFSKKRVRLLLSSHQFPKKRVQLLLKRLTLPPWDGLDDNVKISSLLGSSLPSQLDKRKAMRDQWLSCTQNYCSLIALKLSSTLSSTSQTTGSN